MIHSEEQKNAPLPEEAEQITVTPENQEKEDVEQDKDNDEDDEQKPPSEDWAIFRADGVEIQINLQERNESEKMEFSAENGEVTQEEDEEDAEKFFIGEF